MHKTKLCILFKTTVGARIARPVIRQILIIVRKTVRCGHRTLQGNGKFYRKMEKISIVCVNVRLFGFQKRARKTHQTKIPSILKQKIAPTLHRCIICKLQLAICNLNPAYVAQLHGTKTEAHGKGIVDLVHGALIQHAHFFF